MSSPLAGIKVVELAGLAPVPFCGKILRDFGADVVRVDRRQSWMQDNLAAGKRSIILELGHPIDFAVFVEIIKKADVLLDPYRPGVLNRKGLSDDKLLEMNPKLVVAHLTGWGSTGPMAHLAGHDVNYLSLTGVLASLGRSDKTPPLFPQNLLADFAGGALICALGVVMALYKRQSTGRGDIIDCAMLDGTIYLSTFIFQSYNAGLLTTQRGTSLLDSGAYFYEIYACRDEKYVAVGCLEPQFFHNFLQILKRSVDSPEVSNINESTYMDKETWPAMKTVLTQVFKTKDRDEWVAIFHDNDHCVTPVLSYDEAPQHPQNIYRTNFLSSSPIIPAPAPKLRFSPASLIKSSSFVEPGEHTAEILMEYNIASALVHDVMVRNKPMEKL